MDLNHIRKKIDILDTKLLKLLNDRMELSLIAGRTKTKIEDPAREKEIMEKVTKELGRLIDPQFNQRLFADIFIKSKDLQEKRYQLIAFQGEHGAYSEVAARKWSKELVPIPCNDFAEVFDGITEGRYDYGIVPVENTLGGVVGQVNDLLISTNLHVVGAIDLPIHHCLIALPETDYREIRTVHSHPQALAQCRHFLARNKLEGISYYDTAGAARWLVDKTPKAAAAIAGRLAAELYNLEVIKENIEDLDTNRTRFLILAKEENQEKGDKCSIIFSTAHKAGTLFRVLEFFAKESINLSRIESVPSRPGSYAFFLDFLGSRDDSRIQTIMNELKIHTSELKILGFYTERKIDE